MKWMGGWSWGDYCEAPTELISAIRAAMHREYEEWKDSQR